VTAPPGSVGKPDPDPHQDPIAVAMVEVVAEQGYESSTIEEVVARAGVSREEFDRRFADKDDCALKVFEAFTEDYKWTIQTAYDSQSDWRSSLRAAAYAVADWVVANPKLVRFGAVELLAAEDEMVRVRREEAFQFSAGLIDAGRAEAENPDKISDATAVMAIGSIVQLLTHRIQSGGAVTPREVVPQMMYQAVRPYVGEESAREELTIPPPGT
jgi:AcrR family transcriptional regulator